jgi:signal transduction histidine kinase
LTAREVTENLPGEEHRREHERLTLVNTKLEDALKQKDILLGVMSHELRTPLTTIYGNSELLLRRLDDLDSASREHAIRDIRAEAAHLNRVVESLLLLARASLHAPIDTEPVVLGSFVRHIIAGRRELVPERVITVSEKPSGLIADAKPVYLEQVIQNLVNNAAKYSAPSQPIEIRIRRQDEALMISALDRGIGLKSEECEIVFQAFYRTPAAVEKAEGAGIGLAVCKLLVQAQSGRIWAQPRRGGGASFRLSLPRYDETGFEVGPL